LVIKIYLKWGNISKIQRVAFSVFLCSVARLFFVPVLANKRAYMLGVRCSMRCSALVPAKFCPCLTTISSRFYTL